MDGAPPFLSLVTPNLTYPENLQIIHLFLSLLYEQIHKFDYVEIKILPRFQQWKSIISSSARRAGVPGMRRTRDSEQKIRRSQSSITFNKTIRRNLNLVKSYSSSLFIFTFSFPGLFGWVSETKLFGISSFDVVVGGKKPVDLAREIRPSTRKGVAGAESTYKGR